MVSMHHVDRNCMGTKSNVLIVFLPAKKNSGYQPLTPYQNFHQHLKVYIAALSSWARLGSWALINLLEKQTHAIHAACVMKRFSASFLGEVVLRDSKLSKKKHRQNPFIALLYAAFVQLLSCFFSVMLDRRAP